jgi:hypothetical protein
MSFGPVLAAALACALALAVLTRTLHRPMDGPGETGLPQNRQAVRE